jgi:hypothetical protein
LARPAPDHRLRAVWLDDRFTMACAQNIQIGAGGEPELVLFLSFELDLFVRADPCQARPVATI